MKAILPEFRTQLPASVNLDILTDRSITIQHSVDDVKFTLVLAIILVVLVIFLFLRTLSATLIPSRNPRFTWLMRSGVGWRSAPRSVSIVSSARRSSMSRAPTVHPGRPVSSARSAFWNASLKVRPIDIDSPTLFICVVSNGLADGNFSKAKRGTFTTT